MTKSGSRGKKKELNKVSSIKSAMKRGGRSFKHTDLFDAIKEAQKDPEFIRDINKFIKAATRVYKLD